MAVTKIIRTEWRRISAIEPYNKAGNSTIGKHSTIIGDRQAPME